MKIAYSDSIPQVDAFYFNFKSIFPRCIIGPDKTFFCIQFRDHFNESSGKILEALFEFIPGLN